MLGLIARRVGAMAVVLQFLVVVVFTLQRLTPTDAVDHLILPGLCITLALGTGYVMVNTLVDVLQAVADPRIAL